ncbi:sugar phosphate isomerase/epimerase [Periweissella cryptocerci]|uniref:Sugar phosphate isomerase/epimerase n=1 Tax=Periweissella cryptocerci TaxID=2506420 RepID=A0A4V1AID6_9LACO|nr:TIM barrel protein [Periweissella cryptocerci]QBO35135.1 sugar phosphate isomerase/epimerase [Periweissella cryptocerci]
MKHTQIVLNNLVFAKDVAAGVKQLALLDQALALGITNVEVRREYFTDVLAEAPVINETAVANKMRLFYSVPEEVFVDGQINPDLQKYFDEAQALGIYAIKFNIGDFANFTGDLKRELAPFTSQGLQVNIENDQTKISGTLQPVEKFLKQAELAGVEVGYVYDLGNWRFVGEDELQAARALAPYTQYIHVKDVEYVDEKPVVVPLGDGVVDWRQALALLPNDKPVAIEYPTDNTETIVAAIAALTEV